MVQRCLFEKKCLHLSQGFLDCTKTHQWKVCTVLTFTCFSFFQILNKEANERYFNISFSMCHFIGHHLMYEYNQVWTRPRTQTYLLLWFHNVKAVFSKIKGYRFVAYDICFRTLCVVAQWNFISALRSPTLAGKQDISLRHARTLSCSGRKQYGNEYYWDLGDQTPCFHLYISKEINGF